MVKLIGFSGYIGAGKDQSAKIAQELLQLQIDTDSGFPTWDIKRFSGKVKQIASLLTGIDIEKFEDQEFKKSYLDDFGMTVRLLLQKIGTECIRDHLHKDAWVKALFADYSKHSNWLITDVRFLNEAVAIKERGGILIRIKRGNATSDHPSEMALDNYGFDYTIDNNGTIEGLTKSLKAILNDIKITELA